MLCARQILPFGSKFIILTHVHCVHSSRKDAKKTLLTVKPEYLGLDLLCDLRVLRARNSILVSRNKGIYCGLILSIPFIPDSYCPAFIRVCLWLRKES